MTLATAEKILKGPLPNWLLSEVAQDEERLEGYTQEDLGKPEQEGLFTAYEAIQKILKDYSKTGNVAVLKDKKGQIASLIFKADANILKRDLVKLAVYTNRTWGMRRHFEEPEMLAGWFRSFLIADHLKAILWCIEADEKKEFSDISAEARVDDDGWILFKTNLKEPKEEKKTEEPAEAQPSSATPTQVSSTAAGGEPATSSEPTGTQALATTGEKTTEETGANGGQDLLTGMEGTEEEVYIY
jgi:hypothetical protein